MDNTLDTQNRQQMLAYELIANTNSSFFLTGRAGTGKTTFLRKVQKMVDKQFVTLAPTGVAAILAGGDTIHSFFGLPMDVCVPGTMGKMGEARIQTLLHTDTIIIDEVSMVRCDIIDAIDYTMRKTLRSTLPFGGKQIIFVGDMFQLPPVVKQGAERNFIHDLYQTDDFFFYKADVIKRMRMVKIEFQKVYRQEDEDFLRILENVRLNKTTPENLMRLNERVCQPTKEDGMVITLASLNKTADDLNQKRLSEIDAEEYVYEGTVTGRFEEKRFPVDMQSASSDELGRKLDDAITFAVAIAQRNYKFIVPMYRPQIGKIQLLMPIYLKGTYSTKPDFALILTPDKENEYYTPETILPLDAVYQNARLIAKPDDTWLNPDTIL